jgi:hypothetical protein
MDEAEHQKALVKKAIEAGNVGFSNEALASVNSIDWKSPDFTVTDVVLTHISATGLGFDWQTKSAGFGHLSFYLKNDGWHMETEHMDDDFVKAVLAKWVETVKRDG